MHLRLKANVLAFKDKHKGVFQHERTHKKNGCLHAENSRSSNIISDSYYASSTSPTCFGILWPIVR